jgi:type I restriction enzyme S subunit
MKTLSELGVWRGGGTPSKSNSLYWSDGTIPWVSPKDMKVFRIHSTKDLITEEAVRNSSATILPAQSVAVVTRSGILERTLPVAVVEVAAAVNQDLKVLTPREGIDAAYVAYYLLGYEREILRECSKNGTTVTSIDFARLSRFPIPTPPLYEQKQIVAEIETQFARLDDAVASLQRARTRLKRYRASVLKAACEGRLVPTEAELARQEGRSYEPASVLLERIRTEREAAPGKKRGKAQAAPALDTSTLPNLPEGWAWTTLSDISAIQGGVQKQPKRAPHDNAFPFLRVANVFRGRLRACANR